MQHSTQARHSALSSRPRGRQWLWLSAGLAVFCLFVAMSAPALAATNTSWPQATPLRLPLAGQVLYGALGREGSSTFYRFTMARPGSLTVRLSVPTWSDNRFKPQLVLYQPESQTVGPVLSMDQPPQTLASIYPSTERAIQLAPASLIEHRIVQRTTFTFTKTGQYYLTVYNAGQSGGRWRLAFESRPRFAGIFAWPGQWWRDQAWTGWTLRTLFLPLWLVSIIAAGWIFTIKKKTPSKKTKKNGRAKH